MREFYEAIFYMPIKSISFYLICSKKGNNVSNVVLKFCHDKIDKEKTIMYIQDLMELMRMNDN